MNAEVTKALTNLPSDFQGEIFRDIPLAQLTSWRVGGPADALVRVSALSDLKILLSTLRRHSVPWIILGKGTNILFHDNGFRGVVIQLVRFFKRIEVFGRRITAGAGALLGNVLAEAVRHGLAGLETLAGIPGTCGAAVMLNAGAHGDGVLDHVSHVKVLDNRQELLDFTPTNHGYRHSGIPFDHVVCSVTFRLMPGDGHDILDAMQYYLNYRSQTQPLDRPSAGCTFKNPSGHGAGRLIDACGLKGLRIGGAQISDQHANFIINTGSATATEIRRMITKVLETVEKQFGEHLELEVIVLDETGNRLIPGMEAF